MSTGSTRAPPPPKKQGGAKDTDPAVWPVVLSLPFLQWVDSQNLLVPGRWQKHRTEHHDPPPPCLPLLHSFISLPISSSLIFTQQKVYVFINLKLKIFFVSVQTSCCLPVLSQAGCIAQKMGLPIFLAVTVNHNDIIHRTVQRGEFSLRGVKPTLASAMDIQVGLWGEEKVWSGQMLVEQRWLRVG